MDSQMKKGILDMCILFLLSKEDYYGYTLIKQINSSFPEVEESTIYAILRRFLKEELTTSYTSDISNGPQRKYYAITQKGIINLKQSQSDWIRLTEIVSEIGIKKQIY